MIKHPRAFFMLLIFTLAGCAAPLKSTPEFSTPTPQQSIAVTPKVFSFKIASGGDDTWMLLGSEISAEITENIPNVKAEALSTDSLMENLKLLTSGKVGMAFGYDYHAVLANQGKLASVFPDAQPEKLSIKCGVEITRMPFPDYSQPVRIALPLYEQPLLVFTGKNSGVANLSDLNGKRISTGVPNSTTEELAGYVLKSLGMEEKDFTREGLGLQESAAALKEKRIDAFFWSGNISELAAISDPNMILLPVSGADAESVMRLTPEIFHIGKILAVSYSGLETDIETLAVTSVLLTMEDFSNDILQQILSIVFENEQALTKILTSPNYFTRENFLTLLNPAAQPYLHEGLLNYFINHGMSN